mgnify:CR=1 FL=1
MKEYTFLGNKYVTLDELGRAYSENYNEAIEDIYHNSKKLIKFIKSFNRDKKLVENVVYALAYSKYKNNALTFIIYYLQNDNKVFINGKSYTFLEFIEALSCCEPSNNNALYVFMEDFGLSKTYQEMYREENSIERKILADSYYLDKYCYNEFTKLYLSTYREYQLKESFTATLKTIIINGDECFRRASKLFRDNEFYLYVAHKYDFKTAIKLVNENNPVFYSLKLFKDEIDPEELKKIISDTFYWNLLDNIDYYGYKIDAKDTVNRILAIKKEYLTYKKKMDSKKIYSISLDLYIDFSRELYLNYLNFIHLFKNGRIYVKSKYDSSLYTFDKPYCKTLICQDYMKNRIVKLYNPNKNKNENELDDVSNDNPADFIVLQEKGTIERLKKQKKILSALKRLSIMSTIVTIIAIVIIGGCYLLPNLGLFESKIKELMSKYIIIALGASAVIALASTICLSIRVSKTQEYVSDYLFFEEASDKKLNIKQENRLVILSKDEEKLKKKTKNSHLPLAFFSQVSLSILFSIMAASIICSISSFGIFDASKYDSFFNSNNSIMYYGISPVIVGLISLFIKKKGILMVLFNLLISVGIFVILFYCM